MFILFISLLFISVYAVLPVFYRSKRPAMFQFYLRMVLYPNFRKCYSLGLLAMLMVFHFYYLNIFRNVYELALSSALCLFLYSHKNMERVFNLLQRDKPLYVASALSIALLFVPHALPLGITSGTLVFGSLFYPSMNVRTASLERLETYLKSPKGIVDDYFKRDE